MSTGDEIKMVTFSVGGQEFGFNVFDVERVLRYEEPVPLPESPDFLEGTVQFGDETVPVVDLRKRFRVPAEVGDETRVVILELTRGRVGLVVDAVLEVMSVPADSVEPTSPVIEGMTASYIKGVVSLGERTLVMLAAGELLRSDEVLDLAALCSELSDE